MLTAEKRAADQHILQLAEESLQLARQMNEKLRATMELARQMNPKTLKKATTEVDSTTSSANVARKKRRARK